jgi:hypothetical protein
MAKQLDMAALVAGALIALFGVVLLLDASGDLHLRFAALAPIGALISGATLLTAGLTRRG